MTTSNHNNWLKALDQYSDKFLLENKNNEFDIQDYQIHDRGALIVVDKVEYFATFEKLAHLSKMEQDEYLDFIKDSDYNEMREELEKFWQIEQAVEVFCSYLESNLLKQIELYLATDETLEEFNEFKAFVFQNCIFSQVERVNDFQSFPSIDKYSQVENIDTESEFQDYKVLFVASAK